MTLPVSGQISLSQVITELTGPPGAIRLGQNNVRNLAGKPSGQISMSDLWGKSSTPPPSPRGDYISGGPVVADGTQSTYYGYFRDGIPGQFPPIGQALGNQTFGDYPVTAVYSNNQNYFFFAVDHPSKPPIPFNTIRIVIRGGTYDLDIDHFSWSPELRIFTYPFGTTPSFAPAGTSYTVEFLNK